MRINIPNQITLGRLALAIVFFVLLSRFSAAEQAGQRWLLATSFWVFLIAVLSDIVDGYLARAWQQETAFGRVIDPVVDKVVVCGAFIYFAGAAFVEPDSGISLTGVQAWMVVVILLRELLVSALRSESESQGGKFAATWAGKVKMFIQSTTVCVVLGHLAWFPNLRMVALGCVWATVISTVASIVPYLGRARRALSAPRAASLDGGGP